MPLPQFRLDDCVAVVTGASGGIGQSIAIAFGAAGAQLALVSRNAERLTPTLQSIHQEGGIARGYEADVRSPAALQALAEKVLTDFFKVTILVSAAGVPLTKRAFDVNEEDWNALVDTNLKGVYFSCVTFGRYMAERQYGKIINLSSTYAESVGIGKSLYAMTKAGVSHMTRAFATEWASLGVRVNAIAPTITVTSSRQSVLEDKERSAWLLSRIPMQRFAQTDDLTGAALFLASPASDYITGHTLYVDGGWHGAR